MLAIFLGDSLTNFSGTPADEWPARISTIGATYQNEAVGATKIAAMVTKVTTVVAPAAPYLVVCETGTNDIALDAVDLATLQTRYDTLITALLNYRAVYFTIAPRSYSATPEAVRTGFNSWLKARSDITVFDFSAVLEDPSSPDDILPAYTFDGTHLSSDGKDAVAAAFSVVMDGIVSASKLARIYPNTAKPNDFDLNSAPMNYAVSPDAIVYGGTDSRSVVKYSLEARSKSGTLYAMLPAFYAGKWTRRRNQADELTFAYDATSDEAAYLTTANQIYLRNDKGRIVQRFHIQKCVPARDGVRAEVQCECISIFAQLYDEWIIGYSATATVKNHLKSWLDAQANTLPVRLGTISSAYSSLSFQLEYDASRINKAFGEVYDAVGEGDFWVDPESRRLNWKTSRGDRKGQRIKYGLNARGIRKTEDRGELYTRLYLYGAGNGIGTALSLTDAGESNDYIQQNTGTYGIITNVIVNKDITNAATLLAVANTLLERYSTPRISYEVDCLDLSNSNDGTDFSFERLDIGSRVIVIDDALDVEVTATVIEMVYNLDNPVDVVVTLDNKPKDLRFILRDLLERVQTLEREPIALSDTEPPAVGTGTAGTSNRPARGDHSHDVDADAIAAAIAADPTAAEDLATALGLSAGTDIQQIGTANTAGTNDAFARDNHVHKGHNFTASTAASLPSESEGDIAATTGTNKRGYQRINSVWTCLTHLE